MASPLWTMIALGLGMVDTMGVLSRPLWSRCREEPRLLLLGLPS